MHTRVHFLRCLQIFSHHFHTTENNRHLLLKVERTNIEEYNNENNNEKDIFSIPKIRLAATSERQSQYF